MAGHKRPNGQPICPEDSFTPQPHDDLRWRSHSVSEGSSRSRSRSRTPRPKQRATLLDDIPENEIPVNARWVNPNYVEPSLPESSPPEPEPEETPSSSRDPPETWVDTELNEEDPPPMKHETESVDPRRHYSPDPVEQITRSLTSKSSNPLSRTLSWVGSSTPLVTVLNTPKEEITKLTKRARENGLHTAIAHLPRIGEAKGEQSSNGLTRLSSWNIIIGKDAGTVAHITSLHERDAIGALDFGQRNERIGTYRLADDIAAAADPTIYHISICALISFGFLCVAGGGLVMIYVMSMTASPWESTSMTSGILS